MCGWAYGPIYGCRPEIDLYLSTACRLCCYTGTVHTIAASALESPLALESLLETLLESLLGRLLESLLQRATLERAALRED